jgi:hypothetical protein
MDKQEMRQRHTIKAELTSCATVILSIPIVASSASETDLCCFDYQSMYHVHVALLEHMTWGCEENQHKRSYSFSAIENQLHKMSE